MCSAEKRHDQHRKLTATPEAKVLVHDKNHRAYVYNIHQTLLLHHTEKAGDPNAYKSKFPVFHEKGVF
jgi:hypothetical protein